MEVGGQQPLVPGSELRVVLYNLRNLRNLRMVDMELL